VSGAEFICLGVGSLASPAVHGLAGERVYPSYGSLLSQTPNDRAGSADLADEEINGATDELPMSGRGMGYANGRAN